ncbi:mitochondrial ribosomal protein L17 [Daedalea quercina L-15889]|uniref:Mitochondrial ribosomal protein L17 n=1 Tax=Daedalea quercina L-15889 TaxID=1314783 RepID=A0A165T0H6_9APHY|nr:mitochondrial ribosomal protein L17 [Daedalea quercina L-15889]
MKHGVAFRKFSRTSSHRMLMLRNLVTSLLQHEQIKTTLPKAKDTARLAEKIITLGKKGDLHAFNRARSFLLQPKLTPKVFTTLAQRYAERPGGYTRIHKFGNRQGDNAPHAILELVDSPRDLRFEMTARAVGWELLGKRLDNDGPRKLAESGVEDVEEVVKQERASESRGWDGQLRPWTRWSLKKVLKFRDEKAVAELAKKAEDHLDNLLAKPIAAKSALEKASEQTAETPYANLKSMRLRAGQTVPGGVRSALSLAQGALGETWITARRQRFLERRKLGIDKTPLWENP